MKRLFSRNNRIRAVIAYMLIIAISLSISSPLEISAEESYIIGEEIQWDDTVETLIPTSDEPEVVCVEDMFSELASSEEQSLQSISSEEAVIEQVDIQQQMIEEEKERIRLEKEAEEKAEMERLAQIESITADPSDVTKVSNLTEEQYYILTEGTWWEGYEQTLMDLEQNYGINAFFAMSVSTLESGNGTSVRATNNSNYYGAEVGKRFDGLYDNTMYFGDFLNRLYVDKGLVSVYQIGPKYCPPNRNWENYMATNMQELYNKVMLTLK